MSETPGWGGRDALRAGGLWLISCIIVVLAARFSALTLPQLGGNGLTSPLLFSVSLAVYGLMPAALYVTIAHRHGWRSVTGAALTGRSALLVIPFFLIGMIGLIGVNLIVSAISGAAENPQIDALSGGEPLTLPAIAALWLLLAVVVPICEELVFRGVIQPLLMRVVGSAAAILLSAGVFALAHLIPTLMPGLFISGLMLALLRVISGSIWPGVLYHALQNTLALAAFAALLNGATV